MISTIGMPGYVAALAQRVEDKLCPEKGGPQSNLERGRMARLPRRGGSVRGAEIGNFSTAPYS